jgi:hypothetical protein
VARRLLQAPSTAEAPLKLDGLAAVPLELFPLLHGAGTSLWGRGEQGSAETEYHGEIIGCLAYKTQNWQP